MEILQIYLSEIEIEKEGQWPGAYSCCMRLLSLYSALNTSGKITAIIQTPGVCKRFPAALILSGYIGLQ